MLLPGIYQPTHLHLAGRDQPISGPPSAFLGYKLADPRKPRPDGVWAEWSWDGSTFHLKNDRLGFLPLFYRASAGDFAVSTALVDLVRPGETFDDAAMALFLRLGFFVGEDTPFREIRAVPPGCELTWRETNTAASPGLSLNTSLPRAGMARAIPSMDRAIREYGETFLAAVTSLLPGAEKVGVPLSGGRDSRHVLLALCRAGRKPDQCITLLHPPPRPNEDARVAAQVARELGVPHVLLPQNRHPFTAELEKNRLTHFCADEHTWYLPLADYIGGAGRGAGFQPARTEAGRFSLLYDGIAGDVLSAGLYLTKERLDNYEAGRWEALAENLMEPEGYLPKVLPRDWYRRWNRDLARQRLIEELKRHQGTANPVAQFFFWNRTRREIALAPWSILGRSCNVVAPFLHPAVYDFLTSLPASYFLDHSFHTRAIQETYPRFAHLPFESKEAAPEGGGWGRSLRFIGRGLWYFLGSSTLVRRAFVYPRLLMGLVRPSFALGLPVVMNHPIYLKQLGKLAQKT